MIKSKKKLQKIKIKIRQLLIIYNKKNHQRFIPLGNIFLAERRLPKIAGKIFLVDEIHNKLFSSGQPLGSWWTNKSKNLAGRHKKGNDA